MTKKLFTLPFHSYQEQVFEHVREKIARASKAQVSSPAFRDEVIADYTLTPVEIDWASLHILGEPREVASIVHGFGGTERVVNPVYTFELEFTGDPGLLDLIPSTSRVWRFEVNLTPNLMQFEITGSNKAELDQIRENLSHDTTQLNSHVQPFNRLLESLIESSIERRQSDLTAQNEGVNAFGVPIKKSSNE